MHSIRGSGIRYVEIVNMMKSQLGLGHFVNKMNGAFSHYQENNKIFIIQEENETPLIEKFRRLYPQLKFNPIFIKQQDNQTQFFEYIGLSKKEQKLVLAHSSNKYIIDENFLDLESASIKYNNIPYIKNIDLTKSKNSVQILKENLGGNIDDPL
jgi:hypothetical protein